MLTPTLTRDQVAAALSCSHAELGQLLREKRVPLPVRVAGGAALWFEDEVERFAPDVERLLKARRARRGKK